MNDTSNLIPNEKKGTYSKGWLPVFIALGVVALIFFDIPPVRIEITHKFAKTPLKHEISAPSHAPIVLELRGTSYAPLGLQIKN